MSESLDGVARIALERERQKKDEGYDDAHDDEHDDGSLAMAAVCYAAAAGQAVYRHEADALSETWVDPWPWDRRGDKRPTTGMGTLKKTTDAEKLDLLVKAGALIAAEIDRLLRKRDRSKR
jgi:hypothetical protein